MKIEFDDTFDVAPQGVNVRLENEVPESEVSILDNRIPRPSFTVGNVRNDGEARLEEVSERRTQSALQIEAIADDDELLPVHTLSHHI